MIILKMAKIYISEAIKLALRRPECFHPVILISQFQTWLNYLGEDKGSQTPWLCFSAMNFLDNILQPYMRVFEFGSGGSTIYFAMRVKEVISVEHDRDWFSITKERISAGGFDNVILHLQEPVLDCSLQRLSASKPDSYFSNNANYFGMSFKDYASYIDCYPDDYFDLILIDGRVRLSCFKHSMNKLKPGGYIVLDDAERHSYSYIHTTLMNRAWRKFSFYGPSPRVFHFSETCFWQKDLSSNSL